MLTKRPLLDTAADLELFVTDSSRQRAERSAFQLSNTLLVGEPGSGKTSLLYKIRGNANSHGASPPSAILVDARLADTPEALIALLISEATDAGWIAGSDERPRSDDPFAAVTTLRRLRDAPENSIVLIDDPSSEQAAVLFGRLRDELWQLPVWFTVAVRPTVETDVLARPPADAFFDARIELEPFAPEKALEMLTLRSIPGTQPIPPDQPVQPRTALMMSDASLGAASLYGTQLQKRLIDLADAASGRAGGMLVAEIWNRGPVSASDSDLQRSLGLSRPRLTQLLTALENDGILHSFREPSVGTTGRPRMLYDINRTR